jgi:hypothetical protein
MNVQRGFDFSEASDLLFVSDTLFGICTMQFSGFVVFMDLFDVLTTQTIIDPSWTDRDLVFWGFCCSFLFWERTKNAENGGISATLILMIHKVKSVLKLCGLFGGILRKSGLFFFGRRNFSKLLAQNNEIRRQTKVVARP